MAYQFFFSVCFSREGVTYVSLCNEKFRELSCSPPAMPIKDYLSQKHDNFRPGISDLHLHLVAEMGPGGYLTHVWV